VLTVSLSDALAADLTFDVLMRRVLDEARTQQAILYAEPLDVLLARQGPGEPRRLVDALTGYEGITILAGTPVRPPAGLAAGPWCR